MNPSLEILVDQASYTATVYMHQAVEKIDQKFGRGFAEKNPALVGAFMQAAALDFLAVTLHLKKGEE